MIDLLYKAFIFVKQFFRKSKNYFTPAAGGAYRCLLSGFSER
jgi:hypothetical protein